MKLIAHRGLWDKINKPNSYKAIYNGLNNKKYIGIETDVRVTKDGIFIIYHDPLYKGKLVKNIMYRKIKNDVCKLESILKIKTDKVILLEIKDFDINIKKLLKLINKYNKTIWIMSFDKKVIEKIRKISNKYRLGVLNYILNSDSNYNYDFICLLDIFSSEYILNSFKKRGIDVIIYGTMKMDKNLIYIIDNEKFNIA